MHVLDSHRNLKEKIKGEVIQYNPAPPLASLDHSQPHIKRGPGRPSGISGNDNHFTPGRRISFSEPIS